MNPIATKRLLLWSALENQTVANTPLTATLGVISNPFILQKYQFKQIAFDSKLPVCRQIGCHLTRSRLSKH